MFRAGLGGRVGSGRQWLPWTGRKDLVAQIRHLLLGGQQVLPEQLRAAGFSFAAPTVAECLRREPG